MSKTTYHLSPRSNPEPEPVDPEKKAKRPWQAWLSGSPVLIVSILLHVLLAILAALLIVERIHQKKPATFTEVAVKPSSSAAAAARHQSQVTEQKNAMTTPEITHAITSTDISQVSLPEVSLPADSSPAGNGKLDGVGLNGTGVGNGTGAGTEGMGSPMNLDISAIANPVFGGETGIGLLGRFFDFTRTPELAAVSPAPFKEIIENLLANGWKPSPKNPHYTSPTKLYTHYLIVPLIRDEQAGNAFKCPESSRAFFMVHYHGRIQSANGGEFCFYGFGDNILIVKIGEKIVLEGSDLQYLQRPFQKMGMETVFPGGAKPVYKGESFHLEAGTPVTIDILIGDEGGVTTSGLFVSRGSAPVTFSKNSIPEIPLFTVAPFNDADRKQLSYLPPACLTHDNEFSVLPEDAW